MPVEELLESPSCPLRAATGGIGALGDAPAFRQNDAAARAILRSLAEAPSPSPLG